MRIFDVKAVPFAAIFCAACFLSPRRTGADVVINEINYNGEPNTARNGLNGIG